MKWKIIFIILAVIITSLAWYRDNLDYSVCNTAVLVSRQYKVKDCTFVKVQPPCDEPFYYTTCGKDVMWKTVDNKNRVNLRR